jgi:hypothetical protein
VKFLNTCRGLSVCLLIDSIEYYFLFDTGSEESLYLSQYEKHRKDNDITLIEYRRNKLNFSTDTLIVQQTNTITMGDLTSVIENIRYSKKTIQPVMGMGFISHFDWIIDINKGRMYVKQIKCIENKCVALDKFYHVNIFDTALRITLLPLGDPKYQLFSIIDSVNGNKVDMKNICEMMDMLNKDKGFKDNIIAIFPFQK